MDELVENTKGAIRMNIDVALKLQDDLNEAITLLHAITDIAFYTRQHPRRSVSKAFNQIEAKARSARNILEAHQWPF